MNSITLAIYITAGLLAAIVLYIATVAIVILVIRSQKLSATALNALLRFVPRTWRPLVIAICTSSVILPSRPAFAQFAPPILRGAIEQQVNTTSSSQATTTTSQPNSTTTTSSTLEPSTSTTEIGPLSTTDDNETIAGQNDPLTTTTVSNAWSVRPGESFWAIAHETLVNEGKEATNSAIAARMNQLIELNRDQLAEKDNPNLIFPGQVFRLIS